MSHQVLQPGVSRVLWVLELLKLPELRRTLLNPPRSPRIRPKAPRTRRPLALQTTEELVVMTDARVDPHPNRRVNSFDSHLYYLSGLLQSTSPDITQRGNGHPRITAVGLFVLLLPIVHDLGLHDHCVLDPLRQLPSAPTLTEPASYTIIIRFTRPTLTFRTRVGRIGQGAGCTPAPSGRPCAASGNPWPCCSG